QVWIGGDDEYQVDVKTGEWKTVDYGVGVKDAALVKQLSSYGVSSDSKNNFYAMHLNGTYIIKVDAKTKKVTPFPTPTPTAAARWIGSTVGACVVRVEPVEWRRTVQRMFLGSCRRRC